MLSRLVVVVVPDAFLGRLADAFLGRLPDAFLGHLAARHGVPDLLCPNSITRPPLFLTLPNSAGTCAPDGIWDNNS